jgi:hypothetical protein
MISTPRENYLYAWANSRYQIRLSAVALASPIDISAELWRINDTKIDHPP